MAKPTVFFSHSSHDEVSMRRLKSIVVQKTASTIDIFMSSDGQSIPLGSNWVHKLEQALVDTRIMFVFLSPHALESKWIYFEAGHAYARDIRVVPVGIRGVDLSDVLPPLNLLQGFNAHTPDSLANLIAVLNQEFSYAHDERFSSDEYNQIFASSEVDSRSLGPASTLVRSLQFSFDVTDLSGTFEQLKALFAARGWALQADGHRGYSYGLSYSGSSQSLTVEISPILARATLPMVQEIGRVCGLQDESFVSFSIWLADDVHCRTDLNEQTSRLLGRGVGLGVGEHLTFAELFFRNQYSLPVFSRATQMTRAYTGVQCTLKDVQADSISALLQVLAESGVIYFE